nr:nuclear transport factor 2 family protein [Deltaproteobacteria bacterium]
MKELKVIKGTFVFLLMILLAGCASTAKPGRETTSNYSRVSEPVKKQLMAYNKRNLKQFVAQFSPKVEVYDLKTGKLLMQGKKAFSARYAKLFKNTPELKCEIVKRIICGNFVIDEELVSGMVAGK